MQNINFIRVLPPRETFFLTFKLFKKIFIIWSLFLIGLYGVFLLLSIYKQYQLASLAKEKKQTYAALTQLTKAKVVGPKERGLKKDIKALKKKIAQKKLILSFFKGKKENSVTLYLKALADVIPKDTWLTNIYVYPQKNQFIGTGFSLDPNLVIEFAHRLSALPLFKTYDLYIGKLEQQSKLKQYAFILNSKNTLKGK